MLIGVLHTGKRPFTADDRDLKLRAILADQLPALAAPPARFGFGLLYPDWLMLGNGPDDTVAPGFQGAGDCVWAGAAHETMLWNRGVGVTVPFTGAAVISDYAACTGYQISNDQTDQGTDVRTALLYRQKTGIVDAAANRHQIGAFVALTPGDITELLTAAYFFEVVGIGIQFPDTAMDQFNAGQPWDVEPGATIDGGHYVVATGRKAPGDNGVLTWGKRQSMTDRFYQTYCVGVEHRVLTADLRWVPAGDVTPGDRLMAFEEENQNGAGGRRYCEAEVLSATTEIAETVVVEMDSGEEIVTTPDHRWFVMRGSGRRGGSFWMRSDQLRSRRLRHPETRRRTGREFSTTATTLCRVVPTWDSGTSFEDGWFAGLLDGEGCLTVSASKLSAGRPRTGLSFSQKPGLVLDRALETLNRIGLLETVYVKDKERVLAGYRVAQKVDSSVVTVELCGRLGDRLAVLGSFRPSRLLAAFSPDYAGRMQRYDEHRVEDVRPNGRAEIAKIKTSSGTMIVDGYPMHNCDEAWAFVSAEELRNGVSRRGLNLTALNAALTQLHAG